MRYEVGDTVRIKTDSKLCEIDKLYILEDMRKYGGSLAVVKEVEDYPNSVVAYKLDVDGGKWWWGESMLEYIPDEVLENAFQEPTKDTSVEMVDHPQHYNSHGKYETIEKMRMLFGDEAVKTWIKLTVFKYMDRVGHKDAEKQEWGKVDWYLDYLKKMESEE